MTKPKGYDIPKAPAVPPNSYDPAQPYGPAVPPHTGYTSEGLCGYKKDGVCHCYPHDCSVEIATLLRTALEKLGST